MEQILEELWYGNIAPCENCGAGDEEIEMLVKLIGEHEETQSRRLQDNHKFLFAKYVQWADRYACCVSARAFRDGFILAARIFNAVMK